MVVSGKVLTDKALEVVESLNQEYAASKRIYPDVHDQNKIKFMLKEYIGGNILDDHLSLMSWSKEAVLDKFLKKYHPEDIIQTVFSLVKSDEGFNERIGQYYRDELFSGCEATAEISVKIAEERSRLEEQLSQFDAKKTDYTALIATISDLPADRQEKFLSQIMINQSLPKEAFKAALKRESKDADGNPILTEEVLEGLVADKDKIVSLLAYRRELAGLVQMPGSTIFGKDKEGIREGFIASEQSKIEAYTVEKFEEEHIDEMTGQIKESGIERILLKMGFVSAGKALDVQKLGLVS